MSIGGAGYAEIESEGLSTVLVEVISLVVKSEEKNVFATRKNSPATPTWKQWNAWNLNTLEDNF